MWVQGMEPRSFETAASAHKGRAISSAHKNNNLCLLRNSWVQSSKHKKKTFRSYPFKDFCRICLGVFVHTEPPRPSGEAWGGWRVTDFYSQLIKAETQRSPSSVCVQHINEALGVSGEW